MSKRLFRPLCFASPEIRQTDRVTKHTGVSVVFWLILLPPNLLFSQGMKFQNTIRIVLADPKILVSRKNIGGKVFKL